MNNTLKDTIKTFLLMFPVVKTIYVNAQTQVPFNNWVQTRALSNGTWVDDSSNQKLTQTTNANPTFYGSNDNYLNKAVEWRFKVATTSDDDFSFLGFESVVDDLGSLNKFSLIDWKKDDQSSSSGIEKRNLFAVL